MAWLGVKTHLYKRSAAISLSITLMSGTPGPRSVETRSRCVEEVGISSRDGRMEEGKKKGDSALRPLEDHNAEMGSQR